VQQHLISTGYADAVKDMMEPWLLNSAAHGLHVNIGRSTKDS